MCTNISKYKYWAHVANPATHSIHKEFISKGFEMRVVGGAVRDVLQDKPPKDIDMATNATPSQIVDICNEAGIKHIMTGFQHGTVTLMVDGIPYEVTTLRIDTETDGRHAEVKFTTDFQLDAARRDLTINAMSVDVEGTLYDYFDGFTHLQKRKVLFVGDPSERIAEDYLRILRYFRFHGRIAEEGEQWDEPTLAAISQNKSGLKQISRERIWLEMQKMIVGNHAPAILQKMRSLGIFPLINLDSDSINIDHIAAQHAIARLDEIKPVSLLSYGFKTTEDFSKVRKSWKMSSDEQYIGQFVIKHRHQDKLKHFQDLVVDTPKHCRHKFYMAFRELCLSRADDGLCKTVEDWSVPVCPIRGDQVIKHLGIPKGPLVNKYFTMAKTKWKESQYSMAGEELLEYLLEEYNKSNK